MDDGQTRGEARVADEGRSATGGDLEHGGAVGRFLNEQQPAWALQSTSGTVLHKHKARHNFGKVR